MQVFLPLEGYANAMGFSQEEWDNPQIMNHVWHGLLSDGLIGRRWQFGDQGSLRSIFAGAPSAGIVCQPSALGAELFLWALGHGNVPLEHLLSATIGCNHRGFTQWRARSHRSEDVIPPEAVNVEDIADTALPGINRVVRSDDRD